MSDQDISVSNGTCYSAAGEKLDESFIPCGNVAYGHQTCCGRGDNCLADNACFGYHGNGYGSELTYMAGCTDPNYEDGSCPKKEFDQPWIALTYCDDSNGVWAPCSQEGNPSTLQPGSYCTCTDASKTTAAFTDASSLENIASLPQSTGDHISFFAGHTPTGSPTPTDGSPGTSGTTTAGTTTGPTPTTSGSSSGMPSPTGTNSPNPNLGNGNGNGTGDGSSLGLNKGAKIGIGVGVAVAVVLILGVIAAFMYRRRMARNTPRGARDEDGINGYGKGEKSGITIPKAPEADGNEVVEADGRPAQPFGMRKELEGNSVGVATAGTDAGGDGDGQKYAPYRKDAAENVNMNGHGRLPAEAETKRAQPWDVRTELEGSKIPRDRLNKGGVVDGGTGGQDVDAAAAAGQGQGQERRTGSIAELPGSERF